MKISGIYKIYNKRSKLTYIGSSKEIEKRWGQHLSQLNNNKHHNSHLQNSWNKYGESSFEFSILEKVDKKLLRDVEQEYLNQADFKRLYNISTSSAAPSQEYRMNPVYLLDLEGNILNKFSCGADLCNHIKYKTQIPYRVINSSSVVQRKYRVVTPEFYENNLEQIKNWPFYTSLFREYKRQRLLKKEIHKVIFDSGKVIISDSKNEIAKECNKTRERIRQVTRNKSVYNKHMKATFETYKISELLKEIWFLESSLAKRLKIDQKLKKLQISKENKDLYEKNPYVIIK